MRKLLVTRWLGGAAGLALLLAGCVDKFAPPAVTNPPNYLVVEGTINLGGVTTVRLTRTRSLSTGSTAPVETGASLLIADETGATYPLIEQGNGYYVSAALTLGASHQYQLQLRTAAGRQYASDLVAGRVAPAIDSLSWANEFDGVQVYVSTHDPAAATRHYRWTYDETWEYHSAAESYLEFNGDTALPRHDQIYRCWQSESSSAIEQASTDKLSQDVVSKYKLRLLPANSERLNIKYSILVHQYAETTEEYTYWEQLKKNTESLGTLFDPLPSQITGNVHCLSDANEKILGYVGASLVTERRLFIDRLEFPASTRFLTGYEGCAPLDTVPFRLARITFNVNYVPVYLVLRGKLGYASGTAACIDCRRHGGVNVKPSYWP